MIASKKSPACILRWSVQKLNQNLYAVSATIDGRAYDFVGNFKSIAEANKAGRRYASDLFTIQFLEDVDRCDPDCRRCG